MKIYRKRIADEILKRKLEGKGVAYIDIEGDLVTSIVNGKDCVFTCYHHRQ